MRTVTTYFDYSSPFAYLGSTQIERVAREAGAQVEFRPFLLGALFKTIGTPLVPIQAMSEPRRVHQMKDLGRWVAHWEVPFRWNDHFPLRSVDALRLTLLAQSPPALIHRIMRATWVDNLDIASREVLSACAADAGVPAELLDRIGSEESKQALRVATDQARDAGIPGAPSFVVGSELFWGQDRLDFVAKALKAS